jgi:hypothetical protein
MELKRSQDGNDHVRRPRGLTRAKGTEFGLPLNLTQCGSERFEYARIERGSERDDAQLHTGLAKGGSLVGGGLDVPSEEDVTREEYLGRIAAEVRAVLEEDVALACELLGSTADEVPVLRKARRRAQRPLLARSADAQGRVRALHRLGLVARIRELVVLSVERGRLLREQSHDHFAGLFETVAALTRRPECDAVGPRLLLVPPGAEFEPALGDDVEGGGHVRQDRGVTIVDAGHERSESQAPRRLGQRGQRRPALHTRPRAVREDRIEVIEGPRRLE